MSRGLGKIQNLVLKEINDYGDDIPENQVVWQIAKKEKKIAIKNRWINSPVQEGIIDSSFYKGTLRAIKLLVKNGVILADRRKLNDIEDLVAFYPYKSPRLEIFNLRCDLLPVLKEYILDHRDLLRYGLADNEEFVLNNLASSQKKTFEEATREWYELENLITSLLGKTSLPTIRTSLIDIIIKGRELFVYKNKRLIFTKSFISIIKSYKQYCSNNKYNEDSFLLNTLSEFYCRYFESTNIEHARMKSQLYTIANLSKRLNPSIKLEIKSELRKLCPFYIKNLPGHTEPEKIHKGGTSWYSHLEPEYSYLLDKLIDRHAFSYFSFLSLNN